MKEASSHLLDPQLPSDAYFRLHVHCVSNWHRHSFSHHLLDDLGPAVSVRDMIVDRTEPLASGNVSFQGKAQNNPSKKHMVEI